MLSPDAPDNSGPIVDIPSESVKTNPDSIKWGVVSTIRAPLGDIARFAAYYLDAGASELNIYLDQPDPVVSEFFSTNAQVRIVECNDEYWAGKPEKLGLSHQLRQAFNATKCYSHSNLDWLAHLDVDEFVLPAQAMSDLLAQAPANAAYLRMQPVEMLAQSDPYNGTSYFKKTNLAAAQDNSVLPRIYPNFGIYVPQGFISYTGAKNIARTGMKGIRLGIHSVLLNNQHIQNCHTMPDLWVGHAHAPSWDIFLHHLKFRISKGSYRKSINNNSKLSDVIDFLTTQCTETELRQFYTELCQASPTLLARLEAHDMLVKARLDLDDKVRRWFGEVPDIN
jgi:hypothetical protein